MQSSRSGQRSPTSAPPTSPSRSHAADTATGTAIRRPERGKSHRADADDPTRTACGRYPTRPLSQHLPVQSTAPEDRCRTCWPG